MNDLSPFEKDIRQTYHLPAADPAFFSRLEAKLQVYDPNPEAKASPALHFAHGWVYAVVTLLFIGVMVFAIGPSNVLAQLQAVFGFVPGVGLVDTGSPFRELAEPVSDTKDGITLTIQSAFLSTDQTIITYAMSDLPAEIKRARFGDPECRTPAYLVFPDGRKIESSESGGSLAPDGSFIHTIRFSNLFPMDFDQATLVFPCLEGAAQGKGPEDWQFILAFRPAPEDLIVYPATLVPSQARSEDSVLTTAEPGAHPGDEAVSMPAEIMDGDRREEMIVLGVVEKMDSYWVTWAYPDQRDDDIQINGQLYVTPFNPVLYDANGVELPEPDHETRLELWNYEDSLRNQLSDQDRLKYVSTMHTFVVPKSGIAFPVYARQDVYERSFPEKEV